MEGFHSQGRKLVTLGSGGVGGGGARPWFKVSEEAACPPLGALWISYSRRAAIISTTNKRPLSRATFLLGRPDFSSL